MSLKSKKLFVEGRTYGRTDGHFSTHVINLLGRLGGVVEYLIILIKM